MKIIVFTIFFCMVCSISFAQTRDAYSDSAFNGVWWTVTYNRARSFMKANFSYLKGGFAQFKWGEIETKADTYTWSGTNGFDQTMNNLASAILKSA